MFTKYIMEDILSSINSYEISGSVCICVSC